MNSFVNSKNFLVKYLILELFEKLYRLTKYVNTCEKFDRKNNSDKIIDIFKNSIEIIGKEVEKLCSEVNSDLDGIQKFGFIIKISQSARAIIKIHEELKNLHSSWILPEIKTFANDIIGVKNPSKAEINIVLSDNYTFLESNLGKKFEKVLAKVYRRAEDADGLSDNHSFILPKIEFSNPLNWTIIVHEAGHLLEEQITELKNNPLIMPDEIQSFNKSKIEHWAEEIFCDIYATSVLGPAYFISFMTFALLRTMDFGISAHSEIHPSVIIRASIIRNYLRDNNLLFDSDWGIEDYSEIFYECLMEQHSVFKDEPDKSIGGLTKFNRNLRNLIKDLELNVFSISEIDAKRIKGLVDNLVIGVPVGSVSDNSKADISHELQKSDLNKEQIDQLKNLVSERACKVWEILNSGWIYKLEHLCKKGESIFFTEEDELEVVEKINKYGEHVDYLDERLLSSINTSQIIKIIEGK